MKVGFTAVEKILARTSGTTDVRAGDEIEAKPDFVLAYDFPNYTDAYFRQMRDDFGIDRIREPHRFAIFIDHLLERASESQLQQQADTRAWCEYQGVPLFERVGIGHQVAVEEGFAVPGGFVVHFDGHVSQLGTYGALAIGLRRNVFEAFVREKIAIKVPETVRIDLVGELPPNVYGRDLFNHLLKELGPSSCRFQVLEIGGPGLATVSLDSLQTLTGLAMFTGALTAFVELDEERLNAAESRARLRLNPVRSDADATYSLRRTVDLHTVTPQIVVPPSPADVRSVEDMAGLSLDRGFLGSCISGRIEDLEVAAKFLKGRRVKKGFELVVVPSSLKIQEEAQNRGILAVLKEAGAVVTEPTCDHCYGHLPLVGGEQRIIATSPLNVRGRMGSTNAEIFLASAATVAVSAITGKITDPRGFGEEVQ